MNEARDAVERWQQGYYQEKHSTATRGSRKFSNATGKSYIFTKGKRSRRTIEVMENKDGVFYLRVREGIEVTKFPIENQEYYQKLSERARAHYARKLVSHRIGL